MTHRTERIHSSAHSQPEPGPNELYNMVRGLVGDAGAVVRPSRTPRRPSAAWALLPLAWFILALLYIVSTARADETCSSPYLARTGGAKLGHPIYQVEVSV